MWVREPGVKHESQLETIELQDTYPSGPYFTRFFVSSESSPNFALVKIGYGENWVKFTPSDVKLGLRFSVLEILAHFCRYTLKCAFLSKICSTEHNFFEYEISYRERNFQVII